MHEAQGSSVGVTSGVSVGEAPAGLGDDRARDGQRQLTIEGAQGLDDLVQVAAVEVLHGHEPARAHPPEIVRLHHVRMVEVNPDLRLVDEHADEAWILGELLSDSLDYEVLLEARYAK